jgi:hypothetical protein
MMFKETETAKLTTKDIEFNDRLVNHAAEQMRPAGEKIQPHEMSKLDYKNNST